MKNSRVAGLPRSLPATLLAVLALVGNLAAGACVPSSNPFDPDTDPSLQHPGTIRGAMSYPDRSNPAGIVVEIAATAVGDATAQASLSQANNGRFAIEIQPGSYWVRAIATGYQPTLIGPFAVAPGGDVDVGRHALSFAAANGGISGVVDTGGTLPASGIKIRAVRLDESDACTESAGEATSDAAGAFLVDGIIPGRYRVVAFVEGATVGVTDPVDVPEADTVDVSVSVRAALAPVTLTDPITGSAIYTRESQVAVSVDDDFDWATEMRFSEDPTFSRGGGWRPFNQEALFPAEGALTGLTLTTVYAQFQSRCALSPLYAGTIIYDDDAPLLIGARLEGRDGLATWIDGLPPIVVIPDNRATVALAIDAFDASGVTAWVTRADPGGSETELGSTSEDSIDGVVFLRRTIEIPAEEGLYTVVVDVGDAAGNMLDDTPLAFRVLRDLSPPTTPLPAVTTMTIGGDVAYIWLTERDCLHPDGSDYRALVCEENPKDAKFFEVRGGPVFLDFTGFNNPPFAVPVFKNGPTLVEIRAVDEAGNPSVSIGSVVVTHQQVRTVFTVPEDRVLGHRGQPQLSSFGGTALFEIERRPSFNTGTGVPSLVAQPVDRPSIGFDAAASILPGSIRRLSWGCSTSDNCGFESTRQVGPLSSSESGLSWLEFSGDIFRERRARYFESAPDGDGRHTIQSVPSFVGITPIIDNEGREAQFDEPCRDKGALLCSVIDGWAGLTQAPPKSLTVTALGATMSGVATKTQVLDDGTAATTVSITGPRLLAVRLTAVDAGRIYGVELDIDVPAGTLLPTAAFTSSNGGTFFADPVSPTPDEARLGIVASGTGRETFFVDDVFQYSTNTFSALVGVIVPAGVTVGIHTAPKFDDAGVFDENHPYRVDGFVNVNLAGDAAPDSIPMPTVVGGTVAATTLKGRLLFQDNDIIGVGSVAGVTVARPHNGDVTGVLNRVGDLDDTFPAPSAAFGREVGLSSDFPIIDDTFATLETPTSCVILLEVDEQVLLRDASFEGYGLLDDLNMRAYRTTGESITGPYDAMPTLFDGDSYFSFDTDTNETCRETVVDVPASLSFSGTAEYNLVSTNTVPRSGDALLAAGTAPANVMDTIMVLAPGTDIIAWEFYTNPPLVGFGDVDIYARRGADPTLSIYDAFSYLDGSYEYMSITTQGQPVHFGVSGYDGAANYEATVVPLHAVDTVVVPPGNTLIVDSVGTGDADLYIGFTTNMSFQNYACSSYLIGTSTETCTYVNNTAADVTVQVGVAFYELSDVTLNISLADAAGPIVIATIPMENANTYTVTLTAAGSSELYVSTDAPPTTSSYLCRDNTFGAVADCRALGTNIPVAGDTLYVAVLPEGTGIDYDVEILLQEVGCTDVVAARYGGTSSATAALEAGRWALTIGGPGPLSATNWPTSAPSVKRGPRVEGGGAVRVVGAATTTSMNATQLLVGGFSSSDPLCDVTLTFDDRTSYPTAAATVDGAIAARRRSSVTGAATTDVVRFDDETTTLVRTVAQSGNVASMGTWGDHTVWIETNAQGESAAIYALDDVSSGACLVANIDPLVGAMRVESSAFSAGGVVVAGTGLTGPVVADFAFEPDDACPSLSVRSVDTVPAPVLAVSGGGQDVFAFVADVDENARLIHFDRRDMTLVHAGGALESVGHDARDDDVVIALAPSVGEGVAHLVRVTEIETPNGVAISATELLSAAHIFHPTIVGDGVVSLTIDDDGASVTVASLDGNLVAPFADASASFTTMPPLSPVAPRAPAMTPTLAAFDDTLAVVGYRPGGRQLTIYEGVNTGSAASLTPSFGPLAIAGAPTLVDGGDGLLVVTYLDGVNLVVRRNATGTWAVDDTFGPDERPIGAIDDALVILHDPGPIAVAKPPRFLALELRRADESVVYSLPAATYQHQFVTVSALDSGDVILFDQSATPRVLWHVNVATGGVSSADGPFRPLNLGTEGIGYSAAPKVAGRSVMAIKRGNAGNTLMRLRF